MLRDAVVISLSRNFWDEVWRSRHQVMSRLARHNTVVFGSRPLWIEEAVPWRPLTPLRKPGAHKVAENLYAYVPPRHLPAILRSPALEHLAEKRRQAALRRFVSRWPGRTTVLYLWHPMFEGYIDAFPGSVVCYHLFDDLAAYGDQHDTRTAQALERIFARADIVFVASQDLAERYARFGNVHWSPNGVDYEPFAAAAGNRASVPPDLDVIRSPRIGYAGTLRGQIDVALLDQLAAARPDWSLVLIGDVSHGMANSDAYRSFVARQNVHSLGIRTKEQLPAYLAHLDVGLLPYRLEGAARFCYPLKMHEYLAAGIPVVASALQAVEEFTSVIRIANGVDEWIDAIGDALEERGETALVERQAVARANSWDERTATISRALHIAATRRSPK